MEKVKQYRHELKFAVSYADYLAMRTRLQMIMRRDPHVDDNGLYLIRSIYFDNSDDKVLFEKINGYGRREKFRIRYYNDDFSYIKLEKKQKFSELSYKCSARLTHEEMDRILSGDTSFMKEHDSEVVREFYTKMKYQCLRPRTLVSYIREPYIYKAGNVRVTFDSKIRTSLFTRRFLTPSVSDICATDTPSDMLLEIKYDAFLPEMIQDIIQGRGLRQQAFSKYGTSRRFG